MSKQAHVLLNASFLLIRNYHTPLDNLGESVYKQISPISFCSGNTAILTGVGEIKSEIEPAQRRNMQTQQMQFAQQSAQTRTQSSTHNSSTATNAPEKKFVAGGISATVWANEKEMNGSAVAVHTISLTRTYKDRDGQWKNSASMRINDIPKAQLVLEKAYEYLTLKGSAEELI